jgi:hypothetical protein
VLGDQSALLMDGTAADLNTTDGVVSWEGELLRLVAGVCSIRPPARRAIRNVLDAVLREDRVEVEPAAQLRAEIDLVDRLLSVAERSATERSRPGPPALAEIVRPQQGGKDMQRRSLRVPMPPSRCCWPLTRRRFSMLQDPCRLISLKAVDFVVSLPTL